MTLPFQGRQERSALRAAMSRPYRGRVRSSSCSVDGQTPPPHVRSAPPLPGEARALRASGSPTWRPLQWVMQNYELVPFIMVHPLSFTFVQQLPQWGRRGRFAPRSIILFQTCENSSHPHRYSGSTGAGCPSGEQRLPRRSPARTWRSRECGQ